MKDMRIIHLPTSVGGNPQGLSKALKELGYNSYCVNFTDNYFQYKSDKILFNKNDNQFLKEIKKIKLLLSIIKNYNIIHFNFGQSIYHPYFIKDIKSFKDINLKYIVKRIINFYYFFMLRLEFFLYRISNKIVFITYQGSDARIPSFIKENFNIHFINKINNSVYSKKSEKIKIKTINFYKKRVNGIYSVNPDLMWTLPKQTKFLPYSHIFLDQLTPKYFNKKKDETIVFFHAPSNQDIKGTVVIKKVFDRLIKEGANVKLEIIENKSNESALKIYEKCDVLIDQLYAGWYGGLAVEAMALGKPVLCYIRKKDLKFIPKGMVKDLPVINVTEENLYLKIKKIINDKRENLENLSYDHRKFFEEWHNPIKISKIIIDDYSKFL